MTTITLNQQLNLRKTHFGDLAELRDYIDHELDVPITDISIDFRPLKKSEATPALLKKMRSTKKLPPSRFTNLTAKYAHR